ncbi:hypothetical protein PENFLA_c028G08870 [Penicillium flavigenum]|uniref:Reverse transcriptase RNase H-like domain-containing protein n=1 Tax=Penicillium flavigenum TaxID=254877 RepID=A0A1V6SQ91_9EURO|nr:hypothetical protein PENFLA_c028G08870 [Penicillium flavigenum]
MGFGVVIYHIKRSYAHDLAKSPPANVVEPIMFLTRLRTPAERNYWATEFEVSCIIWILRKVRHMIEGAKDPVVIYTDHSATIVITCSLCTVAMEKLNLRLVRAAMFIQMFRIAELGTGPTNDDLVALHVSIPHSSVTQPSPVYAFQTSVMHINDEFKDRTLQGYDFDKRWNRVRQQLRQGSTDPITTALPYVMEDGFLYPLAVHPQIFGQRHF